MIAVGTDPQDPQLASTYDNFRGTSLGDELPSLSYDLGDLSISSTEIDQFLQTFSELPVAPDAQMHVENESSHLSQLAACDLTSFFFEDIQRPHDINVSLPVEQHHAQTIFGYDSNQMYYQELSENVTPPHSGGVTPQNISRAASPTWSESSGSMSTSSISGQASAEKPAAKSNKTIPRHKRPSHKRAEIKRRDKIKTCLDDIKEYVPSLRDKGKLSESTILTKAAEYVHHLKDGYMERGNKAAELRRQIECLSTEIHSFQENLPATGLKEEAYEASTLDDLYQSWRLENCQHSNKFFIFSSITSKLFETFKEVVGSATNYSSLTAKTQEWQTRSLALPVIRKQILDGMLGLSRQNSIVMSPDRLQLDFCSQNSSHVDDTYS